MRPINRNLPLVVSQPLPTDISLRSPYGSPARMKRLYMEMQVLFWFVEALHELRNGEKDEI